MFHTLCTKLDKRKFKHLLDNEDEEFFCHLCDGSDQALKKELKEIKTKLKMLDQLTLKDSIEFMSRQYDELLKGIAEDNKKVEIVKNENLALKSEIPSLKTSVKILNAQRVKNDCIVRGVEVKWYKCYFSLIGYIKIRKTGNKSVEYWWTLFSQEK